MSIAGNRKPIMKVVIINTQYVETDAINFKSVVQNLTGKDATVAIEPTYRKETAKMKQSGGGGSGGEGYNSVLSRGVSFKEFDRLLMMDLPSMDEVFRLCAD